MSDSKDAVIALLTEELRLLVANTEMVISISKKHDDYRNTGDRLQFDQVRARLDNLKNTMKENEQLTTELHSIFGDYASLMPSFGEDRTDGVNESSQMSQTDTVSSDPGETNRSMKTPDYDQQSLSASRENDAVENDREHIPILSDAEFANVPKYMKNRASVDHINSVVTKMNLLIEKKYQILSAGAKRASSRQAKEDFYYYKDQEENFGQGARFFLHDDLLKELAQKEVVALKLVMPILRHCKRIKEVRRGKIVVYNILTSSL